MFSRKEVFSGVFCIFLPTGRPDWANSFPSGLVPISPNFATILIFDPHIVIFKILMVNVEGLDGHQIQKWMFPLYYILEWQ